MNKYIQSLLITLFLLAAPTAIFAQPASGNIVDEKTISTAGADCSTATNCAIFGVRNYPSIGIYLNVGTSGTFVFEATTGEDPATATWFAIDDDVNGSGTATADGILLFSNPGYSYIRFRASAISGNAVVTASRGFTGLRSTATLSGAAQGDGALQDGANAAIEATVFDFTNSNPIATHLVDANGDAATIGGGTQYTEGATDATITGTALLFEGAADTLIAAPGTAADGLLVNLGANNDITGTVTANLSATDNAVLDDIADGIAVTNAGTFAVQSVEGAGALLTSSQLLDNIVSVEDAVAGSAFSGVGLLAVRQDAQADLAADGDFIPVTVDGDGGLRVSIVAGAGSGGTALADDADFTAGTTSFTPAGGFYQSTVTACTDGDVCAFGLTAQRTLKVTLFESDGTEIPVATTTEATHDGALTAGSTVGTVNMALAKDFDGAALPSAVSAEGDAVIPAATLSGVQMVMLVSEDGALERGTATTPMVVGDGSGALNVIVDSGTLTAVTSITNAVTVTDGAGALNVICDSGCAGGTQFAEDAPSGDADVGTLAMARRTATPANTSGADGDYEVLQMSAGRLWTSTTLTDGTDTALVSAGGELSVTCGNCSGTGVSHNDDAAFTAASDDIVPIAGVFLTDSVDAGDSGAIRMSANRNLFVNIRDAAGNERGLNIDASGNLGAVVTNAGTFATQVDGAALTALQLIDDAQTGDSVHYRTSAGATEDEHEIKATAGRLFSIAVTNTNAAVRYLRCYNLTAANTTPGTSTVLFGLAIPGSTTGAGFTHTFGPNGMAFSTALTCTFTTGAADSDVAEVAANEIKATYTYK